MTQFTERPSEVSAGEEIDRLRLLGNDTVAALEVLEGHRQELESRRALFEQPQAVADYLSFFVGLLGRAAAECERIAGELTTAVSAIPLESLRQLARRCAAAEPRCLQFRDACINKPLPDESVRPLLNDISITTRDQLAAFRGCDAAADRLEAITLRSTATDARSFPRRALLTRLFKPSATRSGESGTAPTRRRT